MWPRVVISKHKAGTTRQGAAGFLAAGGVCCHGITLSAGPANSKTAHLTALAWLHKLSPDSINSPKRGVPMRIRTRIEAAVCGLLALSLVLMPARAIQAQEQKQKVDIS